MPGTLVGGPYLTVEMTEDGKDSPKAIGMRLASIRRARGMTQERLGELSGHHKQSISEWERGNRTPYVDTLSKLAEILDVTLEELVHGEKPQPRASQLSEEARDQIVAYLRLATQLLEEAPDRVKNRVSGPLEGIARIVEE